MTRRFWVCTALAIPVFLLAMTADLLPALLPQRLSMRTVQWIEFLLATPVVLWGGWPFFVRAWQSVKTWNLNMFTLIGLGVSVAWVYSMVALLFPQIFPPIMQMKGGMVHVYFEAAAVIIALVLLGQVLELRARSRTNAAIQMLLGLAPNTARIVRDDGTEEDIPLEEVQPGDVLRVRPGEKVPVWSRYKRLAVSRKKKRYGSGPAWSGQANTRWLRLLCEAHRRKGLSWPRLRTFSR